MKTFAYNPGPLEYYRGNELSSGGADTAKPMEEVISAQPNGPIEGNPAEEDAASKEKEQAVDAWMNDIRTFIRSIDVSSL
jgi:hypothetical protein